MRRFVIGLLFCAACVGIGIALLPLLRPQSKTEASSPTAPPVQTVVVERSNFPVVLAGLGTVQAWNQVVVRSRVDGQVERVAFEEGQQVKEGDLLVELDKRPFEAALQQASAKIAQDEANLKSATADLERTTALLSKGISTKQLFDQQTAAVGQLTALIKADQAAEQNAKVSLDYTSIRAPISGRLGLRTIDVGNIVHAGDQNGIVTIAEIDPIAVAFTAPETQLPAIQSGMKNGVLKLTAFAPDGQTVLGEGALSAINNAVDVASGTVQLKGKFDNSQHKLWPGMSVATKLVVDTLENVIVVPDIAIQRSPRGPYAYVVNGDSVIEKRDVKLGAAEAGKAVVNSGLEAGEQLVLSGHYRVQPGSKAAITRSATDKPDTLAGGQANAVTE